MSQHVYLTFWMTIGLILGYVAASMGIALWILIVSLWGGFAIATIAEWMEP